MTVSRGRPPGFDLPRMAPSSRLAVNVAQIRKRDIKVVALSPLEHCETKQQPEPRMHRENFDGPAQLDLPSSF
jgi:hypothetical protein